MQLRRAIRLEWTVCTLIFSNRLLTSHLGQIDRPCRDIFTSAAEASAEECACAHRDDDVLAILVGDERHQRLEVFLAELAAELRVERSLLDQRGCTFGKGLSQTCACGCTSDTSSASATGKLFLDGGFSDLTRPALQERRRQRLTGICGHNRLKDRRAKGCAHHLPLHAGVIDVVPVLLGSFVQTLQLRWEHRCASANTSA